MTRIRVRLAGWALIAAVGAAAFVLNALRLQHLQFNLFVLFTLASGTVLVLAVAWLERRPTRPSNAEVPTKKSPPEHE